MGSYLCVEQKMQLLFCIERSQNVCDVLEFVKYNLTAKVKHYRKIRK